MRAAMNPQYVALKQAATSMLVPVYQYPTLGTFWATCGTYSAALAPGAGTGTGGAVKYVIANPASGPGGGDVNYTAAIGAAVAAGVNILGYVDTNFGAVAPATVAANITAWNTVYPGVTSIFLDRADNTVTNESYYHTICNQVHATPGAVACLNFGVIPADTAYMGFADIGVLFENDYMTGAWQTFLAAMPTFLASVPGVPASRFCALVYNVPSPLYMQQVLTQSQQVNIGNVYVTDRDFRDFNPFGFQASYFASESATLAAR